MKVKRFLKAGATIADYTGKRHGVVKLGLHRDRWRVVWSDGEETVEHGVNLRPRYTTATGVIK
jgi:hypothetical protein